MKRNDAPIRRLRSTVPAQTASARAIFSRAALGVLCALAVTACFSNTGKYGVTSSSSGAGVSGSTGSSAAAASYVISNVSIVAASSTTGSVSGTQTANIFFDTTKSTGTISSSCSIASSATTANLPCVCQFVWSEANSSTGTSVQVTRNVQTALTAVQPNLVSCNAPSVYSTEIPNGTQIKISVLPTGSNSSAFTVSPFSYTKSASSTTGSFQDAQGNSFQNVLRYSCYEQYQRGMVIQNKLYTATQSSTGSTLSMPLANQFCVRSASGTTSGTDSGCSTLPPADYSAQAYYYNLYIRDSERGDINLANDRYVCPQVKEALGNNGTSGTQGTPYPLDSTFALALSPTTNFTVGVEAFTKLSNGTDPVSQGSTCFAGANATTTTTTTSSSSNTSSFVKSCLGFAAQPNADGSCPYIRDSSGLIRFTYRLRRYIVLYPPIFDTGGQPLNQAQATDTIYVLDRPVHSSTADPLKPYTMYGPKPCPFSYFDSKGVTGVADVAYPNGVLPLYAATNNNAWSGTNIDGTQLPNTDSPKSCSATLPVVSADKSVLSLATVNANNPAYAKLYIRPQQAWAPHYIEDTDFQACAPFSSTLKDPPLHFARDPITGNTGYCAEVYPTQNPNIASLDYRASVTSPYVGHVQNYTSHIAKNSASGQCTATIPSTLSGLNYPAASAAACSAVSSSGVARHPSDLLIDHNDDMAKDICATNTCDRTVVSAAVGWSKFPLLASPQKVEAAIKADSSYDCTVTWDNSGSKSGKSSPSAGCCGSSVHVTTGSTGDATAHLEPNADGTSACLTPTY